MAEGTWWFRPPWNKGTRGRVAMIGTSRCHGIWQFGDFARHQNSLIDDRCGDCTSVFNTSQENGSRTTYTIRVISAWSCIYLQYILVHAIHSCPSYRISWISHEFSHDFPITGGLWGPRAITFAITLLSHICDICPSILWTPWPPRFHQGDGSNHWYLLCLSPTGPMIQEIKPRGSPNMFRHIADGSVDMKKPGRKHDSNFELLIVCVHLHIMTLWNRKRCVCNWGIPPIQMAIECGKSMDNSLELEIPWPSTAEVPKGLHHVGTFVEVGEASADALPEITRTFHHGTL